MRKPKALRLAAELEACPTINYKPHAAELRRLYADNFSLIVVNKAFAERQESWNERMFALETQRNQLLETLKMFVAWRGYRDEHDTLLPPEMQEAEIAQGMRVIAKAEGQ